MMDTSTVELIKVTFIYHKNFKKLNYIKLLHVYTPFVCEDRWGF